MHVPLHLAERAFALHLLLQGFQRLVDIIVADENLNDDQFSRRVLGSPVPKAANAISRPRAAPAYVAGLIPEARADVHGETAGPVRYKLSAA